MPASTARAAAVVSTWSLGGPTGRSMWPKSMDDEPAAGPEQALHLGERLRLVVDVVQHVDEQHAVGGAVGQRHAVCVRVHHLLTRARQLVVELGAQGAAGARRSSSTATTRPCGSASARGMRVHAGAGAEVDHGLGAVELQQVDHHGWGSSTSRSGFSSL